MDAKYPDCTFISEKESGKSVMFSASHCSAISLSISRRLPELLVSSKGSKNRISHQRFVEES